jgi:hypothetical protein
MLSRSSNGCQGRVMSTFNRDGRLSAFIREIAAAENGVS